MPDTPRALQETARERERVAADHLSRVNGTLGLHAAVLALLLPTGSRRAARVWQAETETHPEAATVRAHVENLAPAARLPWLDVLLVRMRGQPQASRLGMLESTRRVMAARGSVRPIDRLHWLLMRQRLGEASAASVHMAAQADLSLLPQADVLAVARYTAFLSRMVPVDVHLGASQPVAAAPSAGPSTGSGAAWYATVMSRWERQTAIPACEPPDTDGLVHALQELQALAWMQRPVLARDWLTAALKHSPHGRLSDTAADALRLSCALLDSPFPPELEQHYLGAAPAAFLR
jgi:hypothetical protein